MQPRAFMTQLQSTSLRPPDSPWPAIGRAARANLVPGMMLWSVGLILVLSYYFHAPTHAALERIVSWRKDYGIIFPMIATALSGAILPILVLRRDPARRPDYRLKNVIFLTAFWAYKGAEIELWYRLQAHVFGSDHETRTVAIKAFVDQAVYCPFFAVPITVLGLNFSHAGLRMAPLLADFRAGHWYRRQVVPTLLANAIIWIPLVSLVYTLPLSLQIVLFDLILVFFILIAAHLTKRTAREHPDLET